MRRTRTLVLGLITFVTGLLVAWMLPIASAQHLSLVRWSYEDGRLVAENPTEQTYLIIGYSEAGAEEVSLALGAGELALPAEAGTDYYAYPITISPVDHYATLAAPPEPERVDELRLQVEQCTPVSWCPGPGGGCARCPPRLDFMRQIIRFGFLTPSPELR